MQTAGIDQWMVDSLRDAVADFKGRLECPDQIDLDTAQSINDIYEETARIQASQTRTKTLRASSRLKPYLNFLAQYESTIEVFIQVKPDILALIWGPLKLILRFANNLTKAFDKTLEVLGNAGQILPDLHAWASTFPDNPRVRKVLCLFYQDILDLHLAFLNLFGRKKWNRFFEAFWPRTTDLLTQIQGRMKKHKSLLTEEVTLENIIQARNARQHENEQYRRVREYEDRQLFHGLLANLEINLYDSQIETLRRPSLAPLDGWLLDNEVFTRWSYTPDKKSSSLWLQGIPGAGKTVLCAKISEHLRKGGHTVLFAFLTYLNPDQGRPLKVFQSLIFQLLSEKPSLQPIIRDAHVHNHRKLSGSEEFVTKLFLDLVKDQGMIHIVVDGLDEAIEDSRLFLAKSLMEITRACQDVRLLISCRNDPLLDKELGKCQLKLRVDQHNEPEIMAYLDREKAVLVNEWKENGVHDSMLPEAEACRDFIAAHSEGMMLYAKLMMDMLKSLDNLDKIRIEIQGLPDGLDQAYARILERIKNNANGSDIAAIRVLQWLSCTPESRPFRVYEILQALHVQKDSEGFVTMRMAVRNLQKTCGPIIDIEGDQVRLVHFSAKEYLLKGDESLLDIVESNQEIASTILTYLGFNSFRSVVSETWDEEDVKEKIKSKDFILFEYAARQWLSHFRRSCTAGQTLPQHLIDALSKFIKQWKNEGHQPRDNVIVHTRYSSLDAFTSLQSVIAQVESHERRCHSAIDEPGWSFPVPINWIRC
ncbi:NACHT domain protein [Apiospora arundinis]